MAFERERTIERARRKSALARFIGMPGMPTRCLDVLQNLQTLSFFPRITLYLSAISEAFLLDSAPMLAAGMEKPGTRFFIGLFSMLALLCPNSHAKPVQDTENAGNAPSLTRANFVDPPKSVRPDPNTRTSNGLVGPVVLRNYIDNVELDTVPVRAANGGASRKNAPQLPAAATAANGGKDDARTIVLPGTSHHSALEVWETATNGERRVRNVTQGTLTPVMPAPGQASGAAVIIVPGGGLMMLSIDNEGHDVARWLSERGVTAFVLKYRLVPTSADPKSFDREMAAKMAAIMAANRTGVASSDKSELVPAVEDAQAALRYVKAHAATFGVDPERVGMVGFSAGARVALSTAIADDVAGRPAFVGLIYGAMQAVAVPGDAPPAFLAIANDDPLYGKNSGLFEAWRAAKRPIELHRYERGGHGFGMREPGTTSDHWKDEFLWWLKARGVLRQQSPVTLSTIHTDHTEKK